MNTTSTRYIYIIGPGRSGTTLLDIILGNADDIFSAGEVNRFTKRDGIPHDARDTEVEEFWTFVRNEMQESFDQSPAEYFPLSQKYEYHSAALKSLFWSWNSAAFKKYLSYQKKLLESVATLAFSQYGKRIVIDSSKYPMRGLFLAPLFGKDIAYIYLCRHPLRVVRSFQKTDVEQPAKGKWAANAYLLGVNFLAKQVLKKLSRKHQVTEISYEALINEPEQTLAKLEQDLGIDLKTPKSLIKNNQSLKVGLLFDGNRLRKKGAVRLQTGKKENERTTFLDNLFFSVHKIFWFKNRK